MNCLPLHNTIKHLTHISDNIVNAFDTHRYANEIGTDSCADQLIFIELPMRGKCRVASPILTKRRIICSPSIN
jgi:hypothetical protein